MFHAWSESQKELQHLPLISDMWDELHRRVVRSYIKQCLSQKTKTTDCIAGRKIPRQGCKEMVLVPGGGSLLYRDVSDPLLFQ